jgi:hypothetical protein
MKRTDSPAIPHFLKHLQVYGIYPVPYIQIWIDGKPDFRVTDIERVVECVENRLCGICGKGLLDYVWFIGGEKTVEYRLFTDPPMHQICAEYVAVTCPYVNGERRVYSEREVKCPHHQSPLVDKEAKKMLLLRAERDATHFVDVNGETLIRAGEWLEIKEIK